MDTVQKPSNSERYTPSAESFKLYSNKLCSLLAGFLLGSVLDSEDGGSKAFRNATGLLSDHTAYLKELITLHSDQSGILMSITALYDLLCYRMAYNNLNISGFNYLSSVLFTSKI
jgi:hypothetical protein